MNAREWKRFYADERARLGETGIDALFERAPRVQLPPSGALVFPHTRLERSGELVAAAAAACVDSGADEVLALGVLHGAREEDAALVANARAGDAKARRMLRRVHGPGLAGEHWVEEFSLDGFEALLVRAARRAGRAPPKLVKRFPFLVGDDPESLPGLDALHALRARGAVLVATTDPIHHGVGYETPADRLLPREAPTTRRAAKRSIERAFALLAACDYAGFQAHTLAERSDFRDTGPVLSELLGGIGEVKLAALTLVDYADVFGVPEPTWVGAALAVVSPA